MQRFYLKISDILHMLLICIPHLSTDEHFKLTKGSKLFLPIENSLLFLRIPQFLDSDLKFWFIL